MAKKPACEFWLVPKSRGEKAAEEPARGTVVWGRLVAASMASSSSSSPLLRVCVLALGTVSNVYLKIIHQKYLSLVFICSHSWSM